MAGTDAADTREEILLATQRALGEHGYADLSMAKIADEFDGSQSLLHYHYDTKEKLVAAYVRYAREHFEERAASFPADPEERLETLVAQTVDLDLFDGGPDVMGALLEMYGAAEGNDELATELRRYDELFRDLVRETIEAGQAAGVFGNVDPDDVAWLVFAAHECAFLRDMVDDDADGLGTALDRLVLSEARG